MKLLKENNVETVIYNNNKYLIYGELNDAYILIKEIEKTTFAIQYERIIVNKNDVQKELTF